jgi:hypothetical protein
MEEEGKKKQTWLGKSAQQTKLQVKAMTLVLIPESAVSAASGNMLEIQIWKLWSWDSVITGITCSPDDSDV